MESVFLFLISFIFWQNEPHNFKGGLRMRWFIREENDSYWLSDCQEERNTVKTSVFPYQTERLQETGTCQSIC